MSVAWVFPGQGAQTVGMGRDLARESPAARAIFSRVDEALGEPLSKLIHEGPEDALLLTANAQPAIVATSIAILAAIRERYPSFPAPQFAAGHSLGEYSALVAADALSLEEAVRVVRARGEAMQDAVPPGVGSMAAIMGLDNERLEALCREVEAETDDAGNRYGAVSCANFNAPGQTVIAGDAKAVERVCVRAGEHGGKAIRLKVSAPFHCALMAPAAKVVADRLERIAIGPLAFPVVANVDATPNQARSRVKELLVKQVDSPVRWEQSLRAMRSEGVTHAIEIGPGKVLAGLGKRIDKDLKMMSVNDAASLDALGTFIAEATVRRRSVCSTSQESLRS